MTPVPTRFRNLVAALRAAIGTHVARLTRPRHAAWIGDRLFVEAPRPEPAPPVSVAAWTLLWQRLGRLAARFTTLHERWRAGTLPRRRPSRLRPAIRDGAAPTSMRPTIVRLPRAFAWVNHRIPESAPPTGQLAAMLRDQHTELREFLAAAPQAGRLLRPLCQALGLRQPDWLRLPPRPRAPRPRTPRPSPWPAGRRRPRTHPSPMHPDDKPLQPYVQGAAKAWKKAGD